MKSILIAILSATIALLAGCALGELGTYGGDREAYLRSIKPYLEYWEKPGASLEMRRDDSWLCGAGRSDYVAFSAQAVEAATLAGENSYPARARLMGAWQRCMLNHGYRYVGPCHDTEISRSLPACQLK
jgi:hypothetical protein